MDTTRVDLWLWAARMFKTRTQAKKACDAGHVCIDGKTAKASAKVVSGHFVEALAPSGRRTLEVVAIADKRGPAAVAQTLYVDHTPPPEPRKSPLDDRERGLGRPTGRDRRRLRRLKGR